MFGEKLFEEPPLSGEIKFEGPRFEEILFEEVLFEEILFEEVLFEEPQSALELWKVKKKLTNH